MQSEPRIVQSRPPAPTKRTVTNVGTNEVKTSVFVNLRQAPSPSAKVIRVVAKDTKLRIGARKGRWVQVTDPETSAKGWIYTGNANPPRTTKPSAPSEPSEDTQQKPDSGLAKLFTRGAGKPIIVQVARPRAWRHELSPNGFSLADFDAGMLSVR